MSSAFDTVDREKLMGILKGILNPQDTKLFDFLLTKTELKVRANNFEEPNFSTNIDVLQGDGLGSVCLYWIWKQFSKRSEIKSRRKKFLRR